MPRQVLDPPACLALVPALRETSNQSMWVYRYSHPTVPWTLSIATHAHPHAGTPSLGGFRIAPVERTSIAGYDSDVEAIGLAMGMEEKITWSRLIRAGGPMTRQNDWRFTGGKCVLVPSDDSRVGQPCDAEMLEWAAACLRDCEGEFGIHVATGQDLGHGIMSDGRTPSLTFLHERFPGSMLSDTSKPTAEGNFYLLRGMLDALGGDLSGARIGLIGVGNIGGHVLERLREQGAWVAAIEIDAAKREHYIAEGVDVRDPSHKPWLLGLDVDALVINAGGGSLDMATCEAIASNPVVRAVCGCENLVMPDARGAAVLHAARKIYAPTEFGGMMGYLTAVEEYEAALHGAPYEIATMMEAARRLEVAGRDAASYIVESDFACTFEQALQAVFGSVDGATT
jgi:hypothetical protein